MQAVFAAAFAFALIFCFYPAGAQAQSDLGSKNCTNCGIAAVQCGVDASGNNASLFDCASDLKDCVDASCDIPTTSAPTTTESCESIISDCGVTNCLKKGIIRTRCFLKCLFPYTAGDIPNECAADCILASDHNECLKNCARLYTCAFEPTTALTL